MLRVLNLDAGYGKLEVLKGISLHVSEGEIVTIIGANGAGKSTLLNTITGIIRANSGEILFKETDILTFPTEKIVAMGCSLVPEGRQVFAPLTVEENLVLGGYQRQNGRKQRKKTNVTMESVYGLFPILARRKNQLAGTLSGGEQQMLAIGRALMSEPQLLMMDEPSMGIAPIIVANILETISKLRDEGRTILLVEQNAAAALKVADRGYVMETGTIVLEGTSEELLGNNDVQRAYLGKEYKRIDE
jgi:branched-chain amino acid transport system ATP-binding protein